MGRHWTASAIELLGVVVIVCGVVAATVWSLREMQHGEFADAFRSYRANLGRDILLGLEFLIAADTIGMAVIVPSFDQLGILALIIVIRTFLSFSLQIEIEGRLPWQRHASIADKADRAEILSGDQTSPKEVAPYRTSNMRSRAASRLVRPAAISEVVRSLKVRSAPASHRPEGWQTYSLVRCAAGRN